MAITRKNYPELPAPGAPHYQSLRVGNMLFLSGATARDTEAEYGDMAAQTEVILKRMQLILEAEGGTLANVVKITSFVTEITKEAGAATHEVRMRYFGENLPASTRVQVAGLVEPHLKIEIEAIAVLE
ncbi:MAG: RidA family protein [Dehalococcoidia bacterium]